jgi:hypothetical protein
LPHASANGQKLKILFGFSLKICKSNNLINSNLLGKSVVIEKNSTFTKYNKLNEPTPNESKYYPDTFFNDAEIIGKGY